MQLPHFAAWPAVLGGVSLVVASLWPLQAHALFDDDEARKAILDLRQKFEAYRQETDAKLGRLMNESRDAGTALSRSASSTTTPRSTDCSSTACGCWAAWAWPPGAGRRRGAWR